MGRAGICLGLSLLGAPAFAQAAPPESGHADVTGKSAYAAASPSGESRSGDRFCLRIMYNSVPLALYGETFIEGNATRCDSSDDRKVERISIRYKYRGAAVQSKDCTNAHVCYHAERFYLHSKELECAAVRASGSGWSAVAETAPGCL